MNFGGKFNQSDRAAILKKGFGETNSIVYLKLIEI